MSSHCTREQVSVTSCFVSSHPVPCAVVKGALQSSRCVRGTGTGEQGRASFQGPLSAPSRFTARSPLFALFLPLFLPAWFSQIRKPGFSFAGPDCFYLLPSHIKSHRRVFIQGNFCRQSPSLVPVDRWVCSSPAPCSRKAAFNPTSCNDSCASPAVMSLLLPARGSLHACIASTLDMSQSCFWWYMGFPWSCNPGVILEAAPLSPQLVGLIPASSSTRQTNISTQTFL